MSNRFQDLTGQTFHRLTVIEQAPSTLNSAVRWHCDCECGNKAIVASGCLKRGSTKSCGCYRVEKATIHGMSKRSIYKTWVQMIARCSDQNTIQYKDYGGRGIRVCDSWLKSFQSFYNDMGEKPSSKHQIDRKDNNGDYELGNCRWLTQTDNIRNGSATKLNIESILVIKYYLKHRLATTRRLSEAYNVNISTIGHINSGRTWADIRLTH